MRFLGVGESNDLGALYADLASQGHEVRVHIAEDASQDTHLGQAIRIDDWVSELSWLRAGDPDGVVVFETASAGELQDRLRRDGFQVIGGSAYGDQLELDREFGQEQLRALGMRIAGVTTFDSFDDAIADLKRRPRRCVYKLNGAAFASTRNYVGQLENGSDVEALLAHQQRHWTFLERPSFVLMDYIEGVEMGVGAYFNGEHFLRPACLDFEHKRFFPGDLGELTGEMGTLVTYTDTEQFFSRTLLPLEESFRRARHCGYINLNTIVNADGIWPLEFTCRFGYPGFAILAALQSGGWAELLARMATRSSETHRVRAGYAVGVVLTVPTFPYAIGYPERGRGLPVRFRRPLTEEERARLHPAEVAVEDDHWVTSGQVGYLMVPTGVGATVEEARADAYSLIDQVVVPNLRYRHDIGQKFLARDHDLLKRWGYLPS